MKLSPYVINNNKALIQYNTHHNVLAKICSIHYDFNVLKFRLPKCERFLIILNLTHGHVVCLYHRSFKRHIAPVNDVNYRHTFGINVAYT